MKLIAPSVLSADFSKLGEDIRAIEKAGADWIHIDVMDGHFVPNITMGPLIVDAIRNVTSLPLDVHLMIENPDRFVSDFAQAGATYISVHVETCPHLNRTIQAIRESGAGAGVVLNPATSAGSVEWVLEYLDFVLVMSVNPGFGGQAFIENSLGKIAELKAMINARGLSTLIQVDGGVNEKTLGKVRQAGADVFVAGSAIFGRPDYRKTIENFRKILDSE